MKKKHVRMMIDLAMTVLLPMLMAYSLIGETFHEIAGTLMLALFIAHQIMNRGWYKTLFKGKYPPKRIFQTVVNLLLLVFMILQPVSGILMSKHLYTFIQIPGLASSAREAHLCLAYWGFVLMCLHAGTHLTVPLGRLKRNRKNAWCVTVGALSAASLYACHAFIKRQLAEYMLLKSTFVFFDYSEPRVFFFFDYAAVMVLFAFTGYLLVTGLTAIEKRSDQKEHTR